MKIKFTPRMYDGGQRHRLVAVLQEKRGDVLVERFSDMPEGEWAEIPITKILRPKKRRR
ncbi:MAG TPA: hypothetical protein VIF57_20450 [Polyangia bacterium]|jgi:hypothetical protein